MDRRLARCPGSFGLVVGRRTQRRSLYGRPTLRSRRTTRVQQELAESGQLGRSHAGLGSGAVLVDDPTEHVVASNVAERRGSRGHFAERCGHLESKAAVRPMLVVMPDVVAKDGFEVVATENERPVEALFPYGPYPALSAIAFAKVVNYV